MKYFQFKISNHAWIYLITLFLLMIVFYSFFPLVGTFLLIILVFTAYFFRDPDKIIPTNENLILSPADGIVTFIGPSDPPTEIEYTNFTKISIFLSIFDIHINRIPASGKILSCIYIPGKFLNATLDKSSNYNERNIVIMETKNNYKIIFVQIAGLIARRIVSDLKENQDVKLGDRFGIIKFGSRIDIYIPENLNLHILEGQKVIGGQSILADFNNNLDIGKGIKK